VTDSQQIIGIVSVALETNREQFLLAGPHVVHENGKKVLCVAVLKALHGMLVSSLLWCNKFKKDLEGCGFVFNPHDPCVANKMVNDKQHTIMFHVDDLMHLICLALVVLSLLESSTFVAVPIAKATACLGSVLIHCICLEPVGRCVHLQQWHL